MRIDLRDRQSLGKPLHHRVDGAVRVAFAAFSTFSIAVSGLRIQKSDMMSTQAWSCLSAQYTTVVSPTLI